MPILAASPFHRVYLRRQRTFFLIVVGFRAMNGRARRQADGTDHEAEQDAGDARIRDRDQGRHRVGTGDPGGGVRRRRLPPDRGGDQHQRGARDRGEPLAPLHRRRHREVRVVGAGSGRRLRPAGGPDQPLRKDIRGATRAMNTRRTTMTTFTIDTDNNITAHAAAPAALYLEAPAEEEAWVELGRTRAHGRRGAPRDADGTRGRSWGRRLSRYSAGLHGTDLPKRVSGQ